jgi:hypothetical protein
MKRIIKLYSRVMKHRFSVLLLALAVMLIVLPVLRSLFPVHETGLLGKLTAVFFLFILLSALFAVSRTRATIVISTGLLLCTVAADVLYNTFHSEPAAIAGDGLAVLFLGWCTVLIVSRIFKKETVSFDTIAASLCAYLLMALAWGVLYTLIERVHPGSFIYASKPDADLTSHHTLTVYFSFVVLSTLGLGDILPVANGVRMLVASEAIMGQIYLAVLVARLVGMHITHQQSDDTGGETK